MRLDEAADRILRAMYARRHQENPVPDILAAAAEAGVTEPGLAEQAADYLKGKGLLRDCGRCLDGGYTGYISAEGVRLVERAGPDGPMAELHRPAAAGNASVTIHGNASGVNVAAQSPGARQSVRPEPPAWPEAVAGAAKAVAGWVKRLWAYFRG